tara:strand:+ start:25783 stop:26637 length:855 start_codon:yes stop_codon:yes gene_type:complete
MANIGNQVLVLDDDQKIVDLYFSFLTKLNYQVDCFDQPQKAWKALDQKSYDLIITDLRMPLLDGYEFIEVVRKSHLNNLTPIVLSSSFIDKTTKKNLSLVNHLFFLEKPFTSSQLEKVVGKILETKQESYEFVEKYATLLKSELDVFLTKKLNLNISDIADVQKLKKRNVEEVVIRLVWKAGEAEVTLSMTLTERIILHGMNILHEAHLIRWTSDLEVYLINELRNFSAVIQDKLGSDVVSFSPLLMKSLSHEYIFEKNKGDRFFEIESDLGPLSVMISSYQKS